MAVLRTRSLSCLALAALLLTSCGLFRGIFGQKAPERSIVPRAEVYRDEAVRIILEPRVRASVDFEFTHNVPPGWQVRIQVRSYNNRDGLLSVVSRDDGTLPQAGSLDVPRKLPFRIDVAYREAGSTAWSGMKVRSPIRREEWARFMPPGAWDSGMIQWALPGARGEPDPMVGYVGVKLHVTNME